MNKLDLQMCSQNRTHSHVGDSLTEIIENRVDLEKIDTTSSQKKKKNQWNTKTFWSTTQPPSL